MDQTYSKTTCGTVDDPLDCNTSRTCLSDEPWSSCYLRLALQKAGESCLSLDGQGCDKNSKLDGNLDYITPGQTSTWDELNQEIQPAPCQPINAGAGGVERCTVNSNTSDQWYWSPTTTRRYHFQVMPDCMSALPLKSQCGMGCAVEVPAGQSCPFDDDCIPMAGCTAADHQHLICIKPMDLFSTNYTSSNYSHLLSLFYPFKASMSNGIPVQSFERSSMLL